jgi:TolB-like protein/predicted Zn-dependent protease
VGEAGGSDRGAKQAPPPGALSALLQALAASPEPGDAEPLPLPQGTVVGRFEIVRELGRGAFGVVHEARDRELGRTVALKIVRPGRASPGESQLAREAEAVARLSHPNLVTLYEVGRSEHGPYLVFELLRGKTLQERIDDGPLPLQEAVHVAVEVARGLAHAHAEGVVHRDLKPANVFVTNKGQVKILDFGMAHAFGRKRVSGGTPAYMAPEQWEDDPEDERTDVFALGVMLYVLLSGEYPFPEGKGRWSAEPATAPKLDVPRTPGLADLLDRMLERTPKGRPRDGAAVLAALMPVEDALRSKPADGSPPAHATRRKATFGDLLAELKRRRVFRVMVGYGIFAFAALQVTEPVLHAYDLPAWVLTAVVTAVAVGFPLAVILAWIFDLTVEGVKRTPTGTGAGRRSVPRTSLATLLLGVALLAAMPVLGWYAWKRATERRATATPLDMAPSIAVLPFADMSPSKDQDYLSDGVAEEILNVLSRIEGLKVIGRTSSFFFKGKDVEPLEIGRRLGVGSLLEGSVRSDGKRIRVSVQLINGVDGARLWSENYDREMGGAFALQDEIARDVAKALRVKLLPLEDAPRPATREAQTQYLLALQLANGAGSDEDYVRIHAAWEKVVHLDPTFAPALAALGMMTVFVAPYPYSDAMKAKARELASRAIAASPRSGDGYLARGWLRMNNDLDWAGAQSDFAEARRLSPSRSELIIYDGIIHSAFGRVAEAIQASRRGLELNPLNARWWSFLAEELLVAGDLEEARHAATRSLEIAPGAYAEETLLKADLLAGQPERARERAVWQKKPGYRHFFTALAEHSLGHRTEAEKALADLVALGDRDGAPYQHPFKVAQVHAWAGRVDDAFAWLDRTYEAGFMEGSEAGYMRNDPLLRGLHADPRWKTILRRFNLPVESGGAPARAAESTGHPSIAVLPFADMSEKHDQEYFADGTAEEILSALARLKGLKVIGRTSAFSFKGKSVDLRSIGERLGARMLLEGSVRKEGSRLRITAQLVQSADGAQVWSKTFDRDQAKVFAVQEEIARDVVEVLKVKLLDGHAPTVKWMRTSNPEVYNQYLLGQAFRARGSLDGNRRALQAYEKALALDSGYAPAWAGLSAAIGNVAAMSDEPPDPKNRQRAAAAADRAVALAPDLAEGYHSRALVRSGSDPAGAIADEELALSLNPNYAWAEAIRASLLGRLGRQREALLAARRATDLSPLDAWAWFYLGAVHTRGNDLDRGVEAFQRALEISPEHEPAQQWLVQNLLRIGRPGEALAVARRVRSEPTRLFFEALAQHDLGNSNESQAALDLLVAKKAGEDAYGIAQVHGWRGERDQAFEWLERAHVQGDPGLQVASEDPFLSGLHGDPRWKLFLRKLNLPVD